MRRKNTVDGEIIDRDEKREVNPRGEGITFYRRSDNGEKREIRQEFQCEVCDGHPYSNLSVLPLHTLPLWK
ncbi:hypothetical protein PENTCL1PPCAC_2291 [Pristionchus entomophagus]|uniref:Uncharacterized protein n=1 Tax=Pristionchus entomophagus TaxID=358040 RepID=A0AAV5SA87_9BILA|nr:hypothetical protein PENTCL1PPCAC_2291 [Pristionchus entomophagus]